MKNILRICAMLVICIILVNIIALSTKAIATEAIIAKGAAEVIAAALIALGITYSPSTGIDSWNAIIGDALVHLSQQGYIATGNTINLWQAANGLFYLSTEMLLSLKDWLFSSEIISSNLTCYCPESFTNPVGQNFEVKMYDSSDDYDVRLAYYIQATKSGLYYFSTLLYSPKRYSCRKDGSNWYSPNQNNYGFFYYTYHVQIDNTSSLLSLYPHFDTPHSAVQAFAPLDPSVSILTPDGISLSEIPPLPDTDIETNYPEWAEKVIIIELPEDVPWPGDPEEPTEDPTEPTTPRPIPVIPINPNPFIPENPPTQQEVQNPEPDKVDDPNSNPDSGTDTDTGSNPGGSTGTGGGTISNPSPDDLKVDLTDFFPFCIPFDIYEFFKILSAAPEAPEFDLKLFGFGQEFSFHVDLSPFDSLAALVRAFELMGFIVGLGILTRDKFLRG